VEEIAQEPWFTQLDDVSSRRSDQPSFHVFAESQHSDVRGQVHNLPQGKALTVPYPGWARHVFIIIGISGVVDVQVGRWSYTVRPHSQLLLLPGMAGTLTAREASSVEVLSLLSAVPGPTVEPGVDLTVGRLRRPPAGQRHSVRSLWKRIGNN
jgi:hypothetical protein